MTKEELEKEAVQSAKKFFGKPTDLVDLDNLRIFKNGYLAAAEPREKWIAHLEAQIEQNKIDLAISEHDREHDDYELTEVYTKVEQLEKENADLKCKCRTCVYTDSPCVRSDYPSKDGVCSHYKNVLDENAELRGLVNQYKVSKCSSISLVNRNMIMFEQLTKAKEIIDDLVHLGEFNEHTDEEYVNYQVHEALKNAEQFIKEIKENE